MTKSGITYCNESEIMSNLFKMKRNSTIKLEYDGTSAIQTVFDAHFLIIERQRRQEQKERKREMQIKRALCGQHRNGTLKITKRFCLGDVRVTKIKNEDTSIDSAVENSDDFASNQSLMSADGETESGVEIDKIANLSSRQKLYIAGVNLKCKHCGECFYFARDYPNHMKERHNVDRPFECEQCGRKFYSSSNYHSHVRTVHVGSRPFSCAQCDSTFKVKDNLKRHVQMVHEKVLNYRCSHCSKGFYYKSGLIKHLRVHTGEKPFQCKICCRSFNQKSNVTRHEKIHSREKHMNAQNKYLGTVLSGSRSW